MESVQVAAILAGAGLLASMVAVHIGVPVALIELALGGAAPGAVVRALGRVGPSGRLRCTDAV